jgi:hypothetical protein
VHDPPPLVGPLASGSLDLQAYHRRAKGTWYIAPQLAPPVGHDIRSFSVPDSTLHRNTNVCHREDHRGRKAYEALIHVVSFGICVSKSLLEPIGKPRVSF